MEFLPLFFDMKQRSALVVGGGEVALRKVSLLLNAGAQVTVVAERLAPVLSQWAEEGRVTVLHRVFEDGDVARGDVVVSATNDGELNKRVADLAKAARRPVNVVDSPELCDFIFPSIVDRSPVVVAVSSGGASPVLARVLRARIEAMIPANYGGLASLLSRFRDKAKQAFSSIAQRRRFWEEVVQGPIAELMMSGQSQAAELELQRALEQGPAVVSPKGEVALIGAGPGDPDLLTFRALRLLQRADVIVHDRLVSQPILNMARRDAEFIYVGKQRNHHEVPQEGINELLVRHAKQGKRVVRLKGGDPFIFGRGGEEIESLAAAGIAFQIVPGISAANGAAAYAGIPLTHRDFAQSVLFVTGHLKDHSVDLNWDALVQPQQTVVVYMGLVGLGELSTQLMRHGMSTQMPIAVIEKATTAEQRVVVSTLAQVVDEVGRHHLQAPTLMIIGDVVTLRSKLNWFEASR